MKNKSIYVMLGMFITISVGIQVVMGLGEASIIGKIIIPIVVTANVLFSATHGVLRYGKKNMLIFFLITFIISWFYENLSIITGFPFGQYHYTDFLGFKLLYVPLAIMPAYFGTAYLSWTLAQVLLDEFKNKLSRGSVFFVPFIASFIMVMWDIVFDPLASTIEQSWVWEKGGGFFGVPLSNFMGWFLCVFTIYQLFALYLNKVGAFTSHAIVSEKLYWIQAAMMYSLASFFIVFKTLFAENMPVTSLDNHQWRTGDIYTAGTLILIFTMFFVSSLSIIKIVRKERIA